MPDPRIITPIENAKTVTSAGTPEAVSATSLAVQSVEFIAQKDQGSANSGNIWIGFSATNGAQRRLMAPGDVWAITADQGQKLDLAGIYVDVATNGDGVTYVAIP